MKQPKHVLDLFCGAGGAAMGLHQAWPDAEIVGVDNRPQPRYPFRFVLADAMTFPLEGYDFIWASPPCQRYSQVTPNGHKNGHPDLIGGVQDRLHGHNYVIENVTGAHKLLLSPIMLCGSMFNLLTYRHRWFESSFPLAAPAKCNHNFRPLLVTTAGANSRAIRQPGAYKSVRNAPAAYGIDWMTVDGLKEAIPPAYAHYIAEQWSIQ